METLSESFLCVCGVCGVCVCVSSVRCVRRVCVCVREVGIDLSFEDLF